MAKKNYRRTYTKIVYGFEEVFADSVQEAEQKFEELDCSDHENKCEYQCGDIEEN